MTNISKSKKEFESFIEENLNYSIISNLTFEEYKNLVFDIFTRLNELKNLNINKDDIKEIINRHFSKVMMSDNDSDIMFERRFSGITEEIVEFCSAPFFWETDFNLYKRKWDKYFESDWFKKI